MDSPRWILYVKYIMYKIIYKDRVEIKENKINKIAITFPIKNNLLNVIGIKCIIMKPINRRREDFRVKVLNDKLIISISKIPRRSPDIFPGIDKIDKNEARIPTFVKFCEMVVQ